MDNKRKCFFDLKKKVAIVTPSLSNGGAQRVASHLSKILSNLGYQTHLITIYDRVHYDYDGAYYSLKLKKFSWRNPTALISAFYAMRKYLKKNKFDFVIDLRSRIRFLPELLLCLFVFPLQKTIFTFHLPLLHNYIPMPLFVFRYLYNKAFANIAVSNGIKKILIENSIKNVSTVYNPVDFLNIKKSAFLQFDIEFRYIIGSGRMDDNIKQFDHLIDAYSRSDLPTNNIHLIILGDGKIKDKLSNTTSAKKHRHKIHFLGFVHNPYMYFKNAEFFVLSSLYEGFPMVLIESLGCGTPVVAYDCPTGPSEIIQNEFNGLLVKPNSVDCLSKAINNMFFDKKLHAHCVENSSQSVEHLFVKNISKKWVDLLRKEG